MRERIRNVDGLEIELLMLRLRSLSYLLGTIFVKEIKISRLSARQVAKGLKRLCKLKLKTEGSSLRFSSHFFSPLKSSRDGN